MYKMDNQILNRRKVNVAVWVLFVILSFCCCAMGETMIELPPSLLEVSEETFANCTNVEHVVIPATVIKIGRNAFQNCTNLADVVVPESVRDIDENAFDGCSNLTIRIFQNSFADTWVKNRTDIKHVYIDNEHIREGDYHYSQTSSQSATIIKYDGAETEELAVPAVINGLAVTKIGEMAFKDCKATSIVLPDTITEIGYEAFYYANRMTQINLPDSLLTVKGDAFLGCGKLQSIHIPAATVNLGTGAFRGCRSLTTLSVSEENPVYGMYNGALIRKDTMELITMPFGTIGDVLTIPEGIKIIGNTAFGYEGPRIKSLIIPDSVEEIRSSAFAFSSVEHIEIGGGVRVMYYPFSYCESLKTVIIKAGTTEIGYSAFDHCEKLESVTIPDSVTSIAANAFENDLYVSFIANEGSYAAQFAEEHGIGNNKRSGDYLYLIDNNAISIIRYDGSETEALIVPSKIADYNVTKIGEMAFKDCKATSIVLPDTITEIGYEAFYYANRMTQINLPDSLLTVKGDAFLGCGKLQSIHIPAATVNLGTGAFRGCRSLTTLSVSEENPVYGMYNGALIRKDTMELITMPFGTIGDVLTIPEGIKIIGNTAFGYEGPRIKSLIIPDSVEEIRSSAFAFSSVEHIEIGGGVRVMYYPFSYCESLKTVIIKAGTTEIGYSAFDHCEKLESVTIPDSVTSIAANAFENDLYVSFIANEGRYAAQFAEEHGIPLQLGE